MKALTIGGATLDIFYTDASHYDIQRLSGDHDTYLMIPEGAKLIMDQAHMASGGGATNAAAALHKLDIAPDVCCMIGTDCIAEWVRNDLCDRGIGCSYIHTTDAAHTALSSIIPSPTGDRTILVYRGANAHLTPEHLPSDDKLTEYNGVYMTSLAQQSAQYTEHIARTVRRNAPLLAHNPGSEELKEYTQQLCAALAYIDIFIVNTREARHLLAYMCDDSDCMHRVLAHAEPQSNGDTPELLTYFDTIKDTHIDIRPYMQEIMHRGPTTVVVTNGSEGVYVAHENTLYFGPAPEVDVRCSVGAGDAFGSTFFANRLMNTSIEQAIARGMYNSCGILQSIDAKQNLCTQLDLADVTHQHIRQYTLHHE